MSSYRLLFFHILTLRHGQLVVTWALLGHPPKQPYVNLSISVSATTEALFYFCADGEVPTNVAAPDGGALSDPERLQHDEARGQAVNAGMGQGSEPLLFATIAQLAGLGQALLYLTQQLWPVTTQQGQEIYWQRVPTNLVGGSPERCSVTLGQLVRCYNSLTTLLSTRGESIALRASNDAEMHAMRQATDQEYMQRAANPPPPRFTFPGDVPAPQQPLSTAGLYMRMARQTERASVPLYHQQSVTVEKSELVSVRPPLTLQPMAPHGHDDDQLALRMMEGNIAWQVDDMSSSSTSSSAEDSEEHAKHATSTNSMNGTSIGEYDSIIASIGEGHDDEARP